MLPPADPTRWRSSGMKSATYIEVNCGNYMMVVVGHSQSQSCVSCVCVWPWTEGAYTQSNPSGPLPTCCTLLRWRHRRLSTSHASALATAWKWKWGDWAPMSRRHAGTHTHTYPNSHARQTHPQCPPTRGASRRGWRPPSAPPRACPARPRTAAPSPRSGS